MGGKRSAKGREEPRIGERSFTITTWEPVDLTRALVVIGFPGAGLVGSIATAHLVDSLDLREVGAVVSSDLPPTAIVKDGVARSPIRIYLGDLQCGPGGDCEQLCVVHSDIAPKTGLLTLLAHALITWAKTQGARGVVCLEGFRKSGQGGKEEVPVLGIASDQKGRRLLEQLSISALPDGIATGIGGVALYAARSQGLPALCLVAESVANLPDARGAARLLRRLQPLVPLVSIDEEPLYEAARAFEEEYERQVEESRQAARDISQRADLMYG